MSALVRSLLALAATALLHAACAVEPHCSEIRDGDDGSHFVEVLKTHIDKTDTIIELPLGECGLGGLTVGQVVTVCDPFGAAPGLKWVTVIREGGGSVHITCTWTAGQTCPAGLDVRAVQRCR